MPAFLQPGTEVSLQVVAPGDRASSPVPDVDAPVPEDSREGEMIDLSREELLARHAKSVERRMLHIPKNPTAVFVKEARCIRNEHQRNDMNLGLIGVVSILLTSSGNV